MRKNRHSIVTTLLCVSAFAGFGTCRGQAAEEPSPAAIGAWVKAQVDDGRLTMEFYDPAKPPRAYPGWTEFEFRLDYRYDYKVELPKPKKGKGTPLSAIIVPTFTRIDFVTRHKVQLPGPEPSDRWFLSRLGSHELDHVRVGQHPRLALLAKQLVKNVKQLEGNIQGPSEVSDKWVAMKLDAEISPRRDAIYDLVHRINRKIDSLSQHGTISLPDRDEFLEGLYLKENLDEMKFSYLAEVLDMVDSREYQQARLQFREPETQKPQPK
jgi:hypothetical protein